MPTAHARLELLLAELGLDLPPARVRVTGADPVLPCRYPLGESAAAVFAALGLAAARLGERRGGPAQDVAVDVRHAAAHLRGFLDQRIDGVVADPDPTSRLPGVGLFATRDGWVQTYGVFAPLRERTLRALGLPDGADRAAHARAIARREAEGLVDALQAAGAPAALVQTAAGWERSVPGRALAADPVVVIERIGEAPPSCLPRWGASSRPLDAIRVVDLSRVLAGPVCGRTLAEHGADVLQLSAPHLHAVRRASIDTGPGKRSAVLDLARKRPALDALVAQADVVCANARPGAFERRGLGPAELAERHPGIVAVTMDCYGDSGPWRSRPGFEPLAQASTGWADEHRDADGAPAIVPALACDHLTGFLAALGTLVALERRAVEGGSWRVRTSLARTATWLRDQPGRHDPAAVDPEALRADRTLDLRTPVLTGFGLVDQLRPGVSLSHTPPRWARPAQPPGTDPPAFS